jgi:murein DD-endopeptidase MepM/ murein hydrolase activator NlpD
VAWRCLAGAGGPFKAFVRELRRTRSSQVRLKAALDARIAAYTSEVEALAREEARLNELIRSRVRGASGPGSSGRISGSGFSWPAAGTVTSRFGTRWGRLHAGIDIASRYGAPIKAAKGGRVVLAGYNGGYGNAVVIDHGGGLSTLYGHMSRLRVREGSSVEQGQQIGDMGSTGSSTGNHLHFEVRRGAAAQNPSRFLP